jgi:hypothetical protein
MIDLTVTGHAAPEQDRAEIARRLKEYGPGAVCLLRNGGTEEVVKVTDGKPDLGRPYRYWLQKNGLLGEGLEDGVDIIRVFPPGTRLRVTVDVA